MRIPVKTLLAATAVVALPGMALANSELLKLQADPNQWVMASGNFSGTRYSTLDQINKDNVKNLGLAWQFSTGVLRGHEGGPLVLGDVMYIVTPIPNIVYALDLNDNGRILWKYNPVQGGKFPSGFTEERVVSVMCCDNVNRGAAYADGKILVHLADTTLVALDAKTGKVVWSVQNMDPGTGNYGVSASTGTGVPFVVNDKVGVGCSGAEFGVRCNWTQYDLKTGKRVWRAYSMGPDSDLLVDPEKTTELGKPIGKDSSLKTWQGDAWKTGGGSIWGHYAWDPDLNLLYYGTGNPSTWNPVVRPGDNKWSMTINARNADTGMARWLYQMTPHDEWDYDGINEMILVDQDVGGKTHKALVHFNRNGFAYTMDREDGALLVAEKYDPAVNWATHVDMKTGRPQVVPRYSTHTNGEDVNTTNICPAALGSKDQQPAAYSPKTKLFYVPTNHVCMDYEPTRVEYVPGNAYVGATLSMFPAGKVTGDGTTNMGNFIAWDAGKGKIVWSDPERFSAWAGALATAGDVVFYGTLEGYEKAVDANSGKLLWQVKTPSGIIGNTNTWSHKGKQQIGVMSGVGGWAGIGLAAGLTDPSAGLGAVGGYAGLSEYTALGGVLSVFQLP
ncbi:MAG: methanol/ethanol family PQQ-dependent dehydrogenase [Alphaproteobacteria bacterium]